MPFVKVTRVRLWNKVRAAPVPFVKVVTAQHVERSPVLDCGILCVHDGERRHVTSRKDAFLFFLLGGNSPE